MTPFAKGAIAYFVMCAVGLIALSMLAGCAQMFTAKTKAHYVVRPDGTKEVSYESDKEQVGLDATVNSDGSLKVKVDKSGTLESVVAATLELNVTMTQILEQLLKQGAVTAPLK